MELQQQMNKTTTKQIKKAYNPHSKQNRTHLKPTADVVSNEEEEFTKTKEAIQNTIILSKEYLAKELIKEGYIDSYIDFFYLGWQKTPNMKIKYTKNAELNEFEDNNAANKEEGEENKEEGEVNESQKDIENEDEEEDTDEVIPRHEYDLNVLEQYAHILTEAENGLREASIKRIKELNEKAIKNYSIISHKTVYDSGTPIEAIYFNQKCISIATKFNLVKPLIQSLIDMGDCFEKLGVPTDMIISKNLKEQAKDIFITNLSGQDYELENNIYGKLIRLYEELAGQQEQMKNYDKAIELLNKLLEVFNSYYEIAGNLKDKGNDKINENTQTESYLKIANLYYKMKDYENTIKTLEKIEELQSDNENGLSNYQIQGLYRYAQTYEMQGDREKAIAYLARINKPNNTQNTDDTILAKSLLHLGRLYFREGTLNLSYDYLNKFYRKSKTIETKELMDIARVNLGMIKGTESIEDYINLIKQNDYDKFLKDKLEYKQSS